MQEKPIQPIPASTVILAREKDETFQVYLIRRNIQSSFMGGLFAFPGGKVDPADDDFEAWGKYLDMDSERIQKRLGGDLDLSETVAFGIAAIRETLEEVGVFMAHGKNHSGDDFKEINMLRMSENLSPGWFRNQIQLHNWVLKFTALSRWSQWITPEKMKYRYDTRFFIAMMPEGQICSPDTRETVQGIWVNPEEGLHANLNGEIPLSPPTLVTLHELLEFGHLGELKKYIANRPWGKPRLPRLITLEKGVVIVEPWDPMYYENKIEIKEDHMEQDVLPPGVSFSRIWYNGVVWRPIKSS